MRTLQKQIVSKLLVGFIISCKKKPNRLETENIFLREESIVKPKTTIKKIRVGDLNLGTVGNRKHTHSFFLIGLIMGVCLKLVLNQYVNVECNQLIFIIKTGNDTFLS